MDTCQMQVSYAAVSDLFSVKLAANCSAMWLVKGDIADGVVWQEKLENCHCAPNKKRSSYSQAAAPGLMLNRSQPWIACLGVYG